MKDEVRVAREKWMGDEYRAWNTPMKERDAFDAGYAAGERAGIERAAQLRTLSIYAQATNVAMNNGQCVGENHDYYITLEQLESICSALATSGVRDEG